MSSVLRVNCIKSYKFIIILLHWQHACFLARQFGVSFHASSFYLIIIRVHKRLLGTYLV